jgi:hypothetical protein
MIGSARRVQTLEQQRGSSGTSAGRKLCVDARLHLSVNHEFGEFVVVCAIG